MYLIYLETIENPPKIFTLIYSLIKNDEYFVKTVCVWNVILQFATKLECVCVYLLIECLFSIWKIVLRVQMKYNYMELFAST